MKQITRDIEQVAKFVTPYIQCILVYVISRLQTDEDVQEYKSIIAQAKRLSKENPNGRELARVDFTTTRILLRQPLLRLCYYSLYSWTSSSVWSLDITYTRYMVTLDTWRHKLCHLLYISCYLLHCASAATRALKL